MKRAAIFLHGNPPKKSRVKQFLTKNTAILCADGGTAYALDLGLKPDVVIGDLDSLDKKVQAKLRKERVQTYTYPTEKNETDSELVLQYALDEGYRDIVIFGWMGSRLDHVLANLTLFTEQKRDVTITIVEPEQTLYIVKSSLALTGKKGEYISLIPLKGDVGGVTTKGLKWALHNETLYFGKTRGISNEFTGKAAEITVKSGVLLVIKLESSLLR
ncbi:MAG: thiamine diphosphokinase [Candidatus Levybacteria bacterium]|nr:thiamine diphosphokinase [Candidatus Levybacteria bacterium]